MSVILGWRRESAKDVIAPHQRADTVRCQRVILGQCLTCVAQRVERVPGFEEFTNKVVD
jgi:hypothetical protein